MRKFNLDWQKGYEEGLKVGIENENNRIIKLLQRKLAKYIREMRECDSDDAQMVAAGQVSGLQEAIKLIKGEQK